MYIYCKRSSALFQLANWANCLWRIRTADWGISQNDYSLRAGSLNYFPLWSSRREEWGGEKRKWQFSPPHSSRWLRRRKYFSEPARRLVRIMLWTWKKNCGQRKKLMVTVRCLLAHCLLTVDSGNELLFICTLNLVFFNSPTLFLTIPVMNFPLNLPLCKNEYVHLFCLFVFFVCLFFFV